MKVDTIMNYKILLVLVTLALVLMGGIFYNYNYDEPVFVVEISGELDEDTNKSSGATFNGEYSANGFANALIYDSLNKEQVWGVSIYFLNRNKEAIRVMDGVDLSERQQSRDFQIELNETPRFIMVRPDKIKLKNNRVWRMRLLYLNEQCDYIHEEHMRGDGSWSPKSPQLNESDEHYGLDESRYPTSPKCYAEARQND